MVSLRSLLTTRGRSFVGAGVTLALSGIFFGFRDLTRFGVLLLLLPFASALLVRSRRTRLRIERHVSPQRMSVDQTARVTLTFENVSSTATPVFLAEERLEYALGDRPRFLVDRIAPGRVETVSYWVHPLLRGRQALGPLTVKVEDPFGLANRTAVLEDHTDLVVLPRVLPLATSRQPSSGVGSEGEQAHLIALHGEDDVTVREYREGDDLRRIHWPSTARTGEIMVRQEDRPAQRRAVVLLDPRPDAHGGDGPAGSFEWAVTAAASVAAHLNLFGYAVHLVCAETAADGSSAETMTTEEILDVLAITEERSDAAADEILTTAQSLAATGGFLVAIIGPRDPEFTARIASLRQPGTTGLAFVLDAGDFGPSVAESGGPHADALQMAGWRAVSVGRDETIARAWAVLNAATVGGGR